MKAILTYHSVDETGSVISVSEQVFRRHVEWLAAGHVRVVPLDALAAIPESEDAIALTFDDGLASFGEVAAPLLLSHGLPVTLFVVSDAVGATNVWRAGADAGIPLMRVLSWDELGQLADAGVTIGAHTCNHPNLASLDAASVTREITDSRSRLERELGRRIDTFAYPYGNVGPFARDVVARTFRLACTTRLAAVEPSDDAALLPRFDSYYFKAPGTLESWGTRRFRLRMNLLARARSVRRRIVQRGAR